MKLRISPILALTFTIVLTACSSIDYEGPSGGPLSDQTGTVLILPFENATTNGAAGVALTEMTASSLSANGIQWVMGESPDVLETSKGGKFAYVLTGSVHEYEYKTDLDGDPAVGASASLQSLKSGNVVWQGSASATGFGISSLSAAAQKVADKLVSRMMMQGFFGL